jgi:hypothetical protein
MEISGAPVLPEEKTMGGFSKILNIFFEPKKVFESLKTKPAWLVPFIIIVLISIVSMYLTYPFIMSDTIAKIRANEKIPDEQKEIIVSRMEGNTKPPWWQVALAPVGVLIYFLIVSGILFFVGNVLLGGDSPFRKIFSVYLYSSLVAIPAAIIKIPLALAKKTGEIQTSLALFLSPDMKETFIYRFFAHFDIFNIWMIILVSLGLAVMYNFTVKKSFTAVFALWLLWAIVSSSLAGLFGGFMRF